MKNFKANGKNYPLSEELRSQVKPGWWEMLNPAKERKLSPNPYNFVTAILVAEKKLGKHKEDLIGKTILEVGCNEGARCFLMAKYEDTFVHGIDVDEYTVEQSPDLNVWNPKSIEFVHKQFDRVRKELASCFPDFIRGKVSFETADICKFKPQPLLSRCKFDIVISWDTIEHIIDLPTAFKRMADCLDSGGISYHEYNPFFSLNGGHSLCTLDFAYGHCRLKPEDFERYIDEYRPLERKIGTHFYHKCLNRASQADVRKYATDAGFEVLELSGRSSFGQDTKTWRDRIKKDYLPDINKLYPTVKVEDLIYNSVELVLRKK